MDGCMIGVFVLMGLLLVGAIVKFFLSDRPPEPKKQLSLEEQKVHLKNLTPKERENFSKIWSASSRHAYLQAKTSKERKQLLEIDRGQDRHNKKLQDPEYRKKHLAEIEQIRAEAEQIKCPACKSTQIHADRKGFGVGKALVGGAIAGPVGLLAGGIGSSKVKITCLKCGHSWKPGL